MIYVIKATYVDERAKWHEEFFSKLETKKFTAYGFVKELDNAWKIDSDIENIYEIKMKALKILQAKRKNTILNFAEIQLPTLHEEDYNV